MTADTYSAEQDDRTWTQMHRYGGHLVALMGRTVWMDGELITEGWTDHNARALYRAHCYSALAEVAECWRQNAVRLRRPLDAVRYAMRSERLRRKALIPYTTHYTRRRAQWQTH